MTNSNLPFVLVAENSVIDTITLVLQSLAKHAPFASVYLVVPDSQVNEFLAHASEDVVVVNESIIMPGWCVDRVGRKLGVYSWRAGWYYQQFLKLNFANFLECESYVIWDADTVMLQEFDFVLDGRVQMNSSVRFNKPYFDTYKRLFNQSPPVEKSLISQFMFIDTAILSEMQGAIRKNFSASDWVDAVLDQLPLSSPSEFSEYEVYGNYMASHYPDKFKMTRINWFLYGSEILPEVRGVDLETLESTFEGFSCVAFERHHRKGLLKKMYAYCVYYLKFGG